MIILITPKSRKYYSFTCKIEKFVKLRYVFLYFDIVLKSGKHEIYIVFLTVKTSITIKTLQKLKKWLNRQKDEDTLCFMYFAFKDTTSACIHDRKLDKTGI